jgi:transposase
MEAPMKRGHCIGIDVHCDFCEAAVITAAGKLVKRHRCKTAIPPLLELLKAVPAPRQVVFEEGPLADWLFRNLVGHAEELLVCEPRRNRLIIQDGDKDDDLDAEKLAQLLRGGFVKGVHHTESLDRAVFKQLVGSYHDRVRHRVGEAHRITALLRRHGVMVRERDYMRTEDRPGLLARLPEQATLRALVRSLWRGYDAAVAQEEKMRQRLLERAKQEEVLCRFEELPGIGWIRAATLFVHLDTPWRFRSKSALWKYLGIGLERRRSGKGPELLGVPRQVNRLLKSTILGAAKSAVAQGKNPFADLYRRWIEQGLSPKLARRNVARSLAATLWGLWKNGSVYHPEWVGATAAAVNAAEASR